MSENISQESWPEKYVVFKKRLIGWTKEHSLSINDEIIQSASITAAHNITSIYTQQAMGKKNHPIQGIFESKKFKKPIYIGEKGIEKDSMAIAKWLMLKDYMDGFDKKMSRKKSKFYSKYQEERYNTAFFIVVSHLSVAVLTTGVILALVFLSILPLLSTLSIIGLGVSIVALGRGIYHGSEIYLSRIKESKNQDEYQKACEEYKKNLSAEEKKQEKGLIKLWGEIANTTSNFRSQVHSSDLKSNILTQRDELSSAQSEKEQTLELRPFLNTDKAMKGIDDVENQDPNQDDNSGNNLGK